MAKVLVVDDDHGIPLLVCRGLRRHGHEAQGVTSCADAWAQLELGGWTHLLTDARLPGEGGLSLAQRASARWPELCVVVMSGSTPEELSMPPGSVHLSKPFQISEALVALGLSTT